MSGMAKNNNDSDNFFYVGVKQTITYFKTGKTL